MKYTVELKYSKSTPGTLVYTTDNKNAFIHTVYVKKHSLPKQPENITLTLECDD